MIRTIGLCASAFGTLLAGLALGQPLCGTPSLSASQKAQDAARMQQYVPPASFGLVTIPVHVHVINNGPTYTFGNVPQEMIEAQIEHLNAAFSGQTGGVGTPFRFELMDVTRTPSPAWFVMNPGSQEELDAKTELHVGGPETLNIYTVLIPQSAQLLGWSYLPVLYQGQPQRDGVVIHFKTMPGGEMPEHNEGDTAVHEVGHWLGLYHTYERGCTAPGDEVSDTAAEAGPSFFCTPRDTCAGNGPDPIENFMDSVVDACTYRFTNGQRVRMEAQYNLYRGDTGPPDPPQDDPIILEPVGLTEGQQPTFHWTGLPDAEAYHMVVKSAGVTLLDTLVSGTEIVSPIAFPWHPTTQTWWVSGVNAGGEGPPSAEKTFFVVPHYTERPERPFAVSPGLPFPAALCISTLTPTFVWDETARAARYRLVVQDTAANQIVTSTFVEETSYTAPESFVAGRQYHWHVKGENNVGESPISRVLSFVPQCGPALPSITIDDVFVTETPGGTTARFTATLSAQSNDPVTVSFAAVPGSAAAGLDYSPLAGALTFPPHVTTSTIVVPVLDDARDEDTETFFVELANATGANIADAQGMGSIVDDDPKPALAVGDVSLAEHHSGTQNATFQLSLSAPSGRPVTVRYATADGTATAPSDYAATSGDLTFDEGQHTKIVTVAVVGDTVWEPEETFVLGLGVPHNVELPDPSAQGSIVNDDPPTLSVSDVFMNEGSSLAAGHFTVSLVAPSIVDVTVKYETQNCTALAGLDYTSSSGTLTFIPGQTSKSIPLTPMADPDFEGSEIYFLNMSSPTAATLADGRGQTTLLNDDSRPLPRPGLVPADFNGDGHADLLFRHQSSGELSAHLMTAIHRTSSVALEPLPDLAWRVVGTGDFTNDGKTDIVWRHDASGQLAVWFMNGTVKEGGVLLPGIADTAWKVGGTGDFNHDGRADLLWRHDTSGALTAWLMNGTTVVSDTPLNPSALSDTQWRIVGTGDFNRDGHTDILWRHETSAHLVVWYLQGTQLIDGDFLSEPSPTDAQWQISAVVDIDGDDDADLLWRHGLSGQLVAWLMEGHVLQCGVTLDPERLADLNWRVVGPR